MNTRFTIHRSGDVFTATVHSTAMGSHITAALSSCYLYAIIDGLLWWTINRKLDALVATSMGTPAPPERMQEWGQSLADGEELVHHIHATPFYEHSDERQARIVQVVGTWLPKLAALAQHGPHQGIAQDELKELEQLCTNLKLRITNAPEPLNGIAYTYTEDEHAAA